MRSYFPEIASAVQNGDDKVVDLLVGEALASGIDAKAILDKGLIPGIQTLGRLFKDGQVYLPEVLLAGRAMKTGVDKLSPLFISKNMPKKGTVVFGTVAGDLHDIGKNLVKMMLECNGYLVHDLGRDVQAITFAKAALSLKPDIVGMSALLSTTITQMPRVVRELEEAGVRRSVKVLVGGAPVTQDFATSIGADGYSSDCASAVEEADRLMKLRVR
jgi:methanogenic corrinoid protein MtbC1